MRRFIELIACFLLLCFAIGCGTSDIVHFAEESYKLKPDIRIKEKLALFAMMSAGSSSLNSKTGTAKIAGAPYASGQVIKGSESALSGDAAMEGFRNQANDILLAKFKQKKVGIIIIPPKQVQGAIGKLDITEPYLNFLRNYNYLSASPEFLKKIGDYLGCRYLMVPQLVVTSTSKNESVTFVWTFAKNTSNYSVTILGQVWDMSTGDLVWTGRGTSYPVDGGLYEALPSFEQLAAEASGELIDILP